MGSNIFFTNHIQIKKKLYFRYTIAIAQWNVHARWRISYSLLINLACMLLMGVEVGGGQEPLEKTHSEDYTAKDSLHGHWKQQQEISPSVPENSSI